MVGAEVEGPLVAVSALRCESDDHQWEEGREGRLPWLGRMLEGEGAATPQKIQGAWASKARILHRQCGTVGIRLPVALVVASLQVPGGVWNFHYGASSHQSPEQQREER